MRRRDVDLDPFQNYIWKLKTPNKSACGPETHHDYGPVSDRLCKVRFHCGELHPPPLGLPLMPDALLLGPGGHVLRSSFGCETILSLWISIGISHSTAIFWGFQAVPIGSNHLNLPQLKPSIRLPNHIPKRRWSCSAAPVLIWENIMLWNSCPLKFGDELPQMWEMFWLMTIMTHDACSEIPRRFLYKILKV